MTGDTTHEERARQDAKSAHRAVEMAIVATPTSERRNLLTEANIHLLLAVEKLNEIEKLEAIS